MTIQRQWGLMYVPLLGSDFGKTSVLDVFSISCDNFSNCSGWRGARGGMTFNVPRKGKACFVYCSIQCLSCVRGGREEYKYVPAFTWMDGP